MSATFRVLEGAARLRVGGVTAEVHAPWEEAGIEFDPSVTDERTFKAAVAAEMRNDLTAPGMGAADVMPTRESLGKQVYGLVEVEAVDGPVELTHYGDIESAHPDEVFGQASPQREIFLQPGEKFIISVSHQNAWTVVLNKA